MPEPRISSPAGWKSIISEKCGGDLHPNCCVCRQGALASVLVAEESSLSGGLAWEISCQGSNEPLLRERLEDLARGGSNQAGIFAVPEAGCMAQELQLVGIPGIRQQRQWASIESVMIEKLPE